MSSGLTEANDLIVEDGTGIVDANSYNDIAAVDAYCTLRQTEAYATWLLADESNKVSALIFGAAYQERRWQFEGIILEDGDGDPALAQGLHFPVMADVFDSRGIEVSETVPEQIAEAHIEYAVRAIDPATLQAVPLQEDLASQDASGREVTRERSVVGPIEEEIYYDTSGSSRWTDYGTADQIIRRSGLTAGGDGRTILRQ